jgi:glycosyltransferase involved in cell wall biosynthesis
MNSHKVIVLLASFNGSSYIREQIDSIRAQSHTNWALYVRDDGSCDATVGIVREFEALDSRIRLMPPDNYPTGGAAANFSALMQLAAEGEARYFMFADQDDVWVSDKIQVLLEKAETAEARAGHEAPVLVHSDLEVVDAQLQRLHPSFFRYQGIRHRSEDSLRVLFPQNFVTGCTVLFNRAALDLALPVPSGVVMHDWWLALVAAAAGQIDFVDRPTVRYRQHGMNQVGAKSPWHALSRLDGSLLELVRKGDGNFIAGVEQARFLCARLEERSVPVNGNSRRIIAFYSRLMRAGRVERVLKALWLRVGPQNFFRRLLFYTRLVRLPVQVP